MEQPLQFKDRGRLGCVVVGIVLLFLAPRLYRRRRSAWLTLTLGMLIISVSGIVTFLRMSLTDVMRLYGQVPDSAAADAALSALGRGGWTGVVAVRSAIWLAFQVWIGRYFGPASVEG